MQLEFRVFQVEFLIFQFRQKAFKQSLKDFSPILKFQFLDMGRYGFSVWMGGLPERVRSREIEDFFKGYGRILDVAIKSKYGI